MAQSLKDHPFQIAYGPNDDRVNDFYVPALSRSLRYDRSAGFFSSSALAVAAAGVARLIKNNGKMRLLVGAQLSENDVKALQGGADLANIVALRMQAGLDEIQDAVAKSRLAALAWMVKEGTLEVRVVLPKGPDGFPLPAAVCRDYYHPKSGLFTDADGNQVAFSGSINESQQAWLHNYEQFMVYTSWNPALVPYISQLVRAFETLWHGQEGDWIALPLPEAVRKQLVSYCSPEPPATDPLEKDEEAPTSVNPALLSAEEIERHLFQFLRDAPYMPNAHRLGQAVSAVRLWPHQKRVVDRIVDTFPQRYMICDEVGLGKTLEGGAIIRQLTLTGRVRRALILAPKSVCRQWQEELYEKFLLNVPLYDGGTFVDYFERDLPCEAENPWNAFPLVLASSQLAKRSDRQAELFSANPWDFVLVDEAHHARRKDFLSGRYRRNRLLSLLLGPQEHAGQPGLTGRSRSVLLMTATPMQVDPREVWDLLQVLGMGGMWGASDDDFVRFFEELREGFDRANWRFILRMVRDHFEHGGSIDESFAGVAEDKVGLVTWQTIRNLPFSNKIGTTLAQIDDGDHAVLMEFVRRHTPLARYIFRNTRSLLREYQRRGLLGDDKVPTRRPEPAWIPMRPEERELYDRIEEYISDFYKKYEAERKGLGFIMTVYRRRLTSSFYAITRSLERRLQFLRGDPNIGTMVGLTEEDIEEDDLDEDVLEEIGSADRSLQRQEIAYIVDFVATLRLLGPDSKVEQLLEDLKELLQKRETVLVFTLYTDTMDFLRGQLRPIYGSQVACYSGRGGEIWDGIGWKRVTKEEIKKDFREERIKILIGTDALSEGLNLQTCGMMINFDMPWNPMRVEQRIGRIDRIGQRHDDVWIRNYFYEDTVEARIYLALQDRIQWFEEVVGDLQPILARVARAIQSAAMETGAARVHLLNQEIEAIKRDLDERQTSSLNLDQYLFADVALPQEEMVPVTQAEIERFILKSKIAGELFSLHREIPGAYETTLDGSRAGVTFDPALFDEHPSTLRLLTYHEQLFDQLLDRIEAPSKGTLPPWIVRMAGSAPPLVAYYMATDDGVELVPNLATFEALVEAANGHVLDQTLEHAIRSDFEARHRTLREREVAVEESQRRADEATLREQARGLLLRATYLDLALARQGELFGVAPNNAGFTEEAVLALRRRGFPFAPLIRLVGTAGIVPSPTDPFHVQVQDATRESLNKKLEATKERIQQLLQKFAQKQA